MANTLQLEIVTSEKLVVDAASDQVQIPGKSSRLGILPRHAPLITELAKGEIRYRVNGVVKKLSVTGGFAEVLPDRVTILAETGERVGEIDPKPAQEKRQQG